MNEDALITLHEAMTLDEALFSMSSKDFDYPFKEVEKYIKKAKNVYIVAHKSPDQDAVGSTMGLAVAIRTKYKDKKVQVLSAAIKQEPVFEKDDLLIICDIGGSKRLDCTCYPAMAEAIGHDLINVCRFDHHPLEDLGINRVNIEDKSAGSTCALITLFLESQDYEISEQVAKLLFKGIIADTGRMQYSLSKPTLMAIAMLSEHGIDYERIYSDMYMQSPKSIKGKQYLLAHYEQTSNGVIYCLLNKNIGKSNGFDAGETAAMVHELSGIRGCPIWITAYEINNNEIRCRVRSRGIDIRDTCKKFNGGGHDHACGVVVRGREQLARLVAELDKLLEMSKFVGRFDKLNEENKMSEDKKKYLKEYDEYLVQHIGNVQKAYKLLQLVVDIPEDIEAKVDENIKKHDESKYSEEEYEPYALYFNVDKDLYLKEFNYAWLHHIHANKHHWQHWLLQHDDEGLELMEIPDEYIYEMICDWWAFSVKVNKLGEIQKWYAEHKDGIQMHEKSRAKVEGILAKLASYDFEKDEKIKNILKQEPIDALKEINYPHIKQELDESFETYELMENRLPTDGSDPEFGLPEKKKFPLFDEKHVRSAIKFFGYAKGEDKKILARAIRAKMKKYNMPAEMFNESADTEDTKMQVSYPGSALQFKVKECPFVTSKDGQENAVVEIDGRRARNRVSCLIFRDDRGQTEVLLSKSKSGKFTIPGGGVAKGKEPIEQAESEVHEEVKMNIKNIKPAGVQFLEKGKDVQKWVKENVLDEKDYWIDYFTTMFYAEYDGEFTGHIKEIDLDPQIYKTAKWYKISDVLYDKDFLIPWRLTVGEYKFSKPNSGH